MIRLKLCGNCAFPQIFYTKNLGEITVLFAVLLRSLGYDSYSTQNQNLF